MIKKLFNKPLYTSLMKLNRTQEITNSQAHMYLQTMFVGAKYRSILHD